ncbi:480_t:CDS:2, partial [Racocetra persica]
QLSSYLASTGIDLVVNRDQIFGILRECLHKQAGMDALRGHIMAQMNTSNSFRNPSIAHDYANTAGNNAVTLRGEPIGDFYSKLLKYRKMLNSDEQQIKEQVLRDLSPDLEDDIECI